MAILIEEQKNPSGLVGFLLWFLVLAAIGGGMYYVFFQRPAIVDIATPGDFAQTAELSTINLKPETVISNSQFQSLRPYITPAQPARAGRANPFLGF